MSYSVKRRAARKATRKGKAIKGGYVILSGKTVVKFPHQTTFKHKADADMVCYWLTKR